MALSMNMVGVEVARPRDAAAHALMRRERAATKSSFLSVSTKRLIVGSTTSPENMRAKLEVELKRPSIVLPQENF